MGFRSFVDIEAWQVARQLVKQVHDNTNAWPYSRKGLVDQMDRSAVSIMANIAEGFDSASDADFARYLVYSRQSASELQSHLFVAKDLALLSEQEFESLYQLADRVKSMVIAFIGYLRKIPKQHTGSHNNPGVGIGRRTSDET